MNKFYIWMGRPRNLYEWWLSIQGIIPKLKHIRKNMNESIQQTARRITQKIETDIKAHQHDEYSSMVLTEYDIIERNIEQLLVETLFPKCNQDMMTWQQWNESKRLYPKQSPK
jgi:hypothetical protein